MAKKCECKKTECENCNCNIQYETSSCELKICDIQIDTKSVFYNINNSELSKLFTLSLLNGVNLTKILEEIDRKLNETIGYNFEGFSLYCLREGMTISNIKDFSEAISLKFCNLMNRYEDLEYDYNIFKDNIINNLNLINYLNINKRCITNILLGDNIKTILEKIVSYICTLNICDNNSNLIDYLLFIFNDTSSIKFVNTGSTVYSASVQISLDLNNCLQSKTNGLYVECLDSNIPQTLSYSNGTLYISGGNSVNLLQSVQVLSMDCNTKKLSISNGNTVDLTCLTNSTLNSDEKVKSYSADTNSDYLNNKINGVINNDITLLTTLNTGTNKIDISASINYTNLINTIISNLVLLQTLCNALKLCLTCFRYRITNTDNSSHTYSYKQCDGIQNNNINIGLLATVDVCGLNVDTSNLLVNVVILGNC